MKRDFKTRVKIFLILVLFFCAFRTILDVIAKDYLSDEEIWTLYYVSSMLVVIGAVTFNWLYHRKYTKMMKTAIRLLEEKKTDEYIAMLEKALSETKGRYLNTLLTINLSAGYADKKDFDKSIELLEGISNRRMYHTAKMCHKLNLCVCYYYANQNEKAKELYMQSQDVFKPFRKTQMYGGNIAVLDMLMNLAEGNYDLVSEQLKANKEKWTNPRLQDDYEYIEEILNSNK